MTPRVPRPDRSRASAISRALRAVGTTCALLAGVGLIAPVSGQAVETGTWATFGLGAGYVADDSGGVVHFDVHHQRGPHLFIVGASAIWDLFDDGTGDIAVLYGRANSSDVFYTAAAIGLAYTGVSANCGLTTSCGTSESTIGIPVRLTTAVRPLPVLGIALTVIANANSEASYLGLALGIELGDLVR